MLKIKIAFPISILVFAALACNALAPNAQPSPTKYVIVEPTFPPTESNIPLSEAAVPRVSLEEALVAYSAGAAIFVDVRSKQAYDASHIPGAQSIQLGEFETNITKLKLPKDEWIITYCT
ncbi:MAG TPA: rhodanese-like domain-containing protein [Anaerolineales bacterium]|nr:rhodanese-like domain-containing protein [Anaerolineales bacterium]